MREELGDRVFVSTIGFGLALGGLLVLLVLRAVIGPF